MSAADEFERIAEEFRGRFDTCVAHARHVREHEASYGILMAKADAFLEVESALRERAAELRAAPADLALPPDATEPGAVWVRFGKPFIIAETSYFQGGKWAHFDGLREAFEFGELTTENGWRYVGRVEAK